MAKLNLPMRGSPYIKSGLMQQYLQLLYAKAGIGFLFLLCLGAAFLFSLTAGSLHIPFGKIITTLFWQNDISYVIFNIRLPRSVAAVIAGASLGVSGCVIQNILKNPLASPFTLGISHGAAFGASVAIIGLGAGITHSCGNESVSVFNVYMVVFAAFVGAIAAVSIILLLALVKKVSPEAIVLAGVAMSSLFGASTMALQYFATDFQVSATIFWTFGDIGKAGWVENLIMGICFLACLVYFYVQRWNYNALLWGDDVAKGLGVNSASLRLMGMLLCALIVSLCTAFLGIIGFVGLIAPHIVRMIIGNDYRFLIPYSALFGAVFLLVSDSIAKMILSPVILPVGIITSFLGAPMFFYLLVKRSTL